LVSTCRRLAFNPEFAGRTSRSLRLAHDSAGAWATLGSMERGVVVRGKLHGRHIELDEEVDELDGEVEVFLRSVGATPRPPDVLDVIASLPAGTRSKDEIDRQLADDRAGCNGRD
jgi:hypothetical protein